MNQPALSPEEIYCTLAGDIDQQMVARVFSNFSLAINNGVKTVHLLMQSGGGRVGDGLALYNYFRHLPLNVIGYNGGSIASIATYAYLGIVTRKASASAAFMIHRTYTTGTYPIRSENADALTDTLRKDDVRTALILQNDVKLSPKQMRTHRVHELWFTAEEAKTAGICHEIADFRAPIGSKIFAI